jgi:hypothetical protein
MDSKKVSKEMTSVSVLAKRSGANATNRMLITGKKINRFRLIILQR